MTNSTKNTSAQAFPTVTLGYGKEFTIKPFADMTFDEKESLTRAVIDYTGGSLCMNAEVEFILKAEYMIGYEQRHQLPFTSDDITNNAPTGNIETKDGWEDMTEEKRDTFVEALEEELQYLADNDNYAIENDIEELQRLIDDANANDIEDYPEIMQWFMLDDRILSRLGSDGQSTLVDQYWGRQVYGQSITMDHCMQKACYDLASCWAN